MRRRSADGAGADQIRALPLDGPSTPDPTGSVADRDQLDRGFRRLPVDQRAVFILHHYLGWSLAEIAENLDLPLGTVEVPDLLRHPDAPGSPRG